MHKLTIGPDARDFLRTDMGHQMIEAIQGLYNLHVDNLVRICALESTDDIRRQSGVISGVGQVIEMLRAQSR